jgi:hypothetical protein
MSQAQARSRWADDPARRSRRTVVITGRPEGPPPVRRLHEAPAPAPARHIVAAPARGPRLVEIERRRPPRSPQERVGARPDRIAMWAVLMALFLIIVTMMSAHGA